jgi:hypothetical protein
MLDERRGFSFTANPARGRLLSMRMAIWIGLRSSRPGWLRLVIIVDRRMDIQASAGATALLSPNLSYCDDRYAGLALAA